MPTANPHRGTTYALVLVTASLVQAAAHGGVTNFYVCPTGPADYPTIQPAIDASGPGGTVRLCDATFSGAGNRDISFGGKAITVRSDSDIPENCIIDCGGSGHRGFLFTNDEESTSVLRGVTVRNGSYSNQPGGAIRCGQPGFPPFIPAAHGSPTIENCIITNNHAQNGGGISCTNGSDPYIYECTFSGNGRVGLGTGGGGGGIYVLDSSPTVTACVFSGNAISMGGGGAIYLENSITSVWGCDFSANSAALGGAIGVNNADPEIRLSVFSENSATTGGGALYAYGGSADPFVLNCTFYANSALVGGTIYSHTSASVMIDDSIIAMGTSGEAVYCAMGGTATLDCCDVYGNAGGDWVACIAGQDASARNISLDPLFCGAVNGDFSLRDGSPCFMGTPQHPVGCGMIGAKPLGCSGPITWTVCPDGSGDFTTIQGAINTSLDGDIVELCPATYTGTGNRDLNYGGRAITVRCQTGDPADCTIDCQGSPAQPRRGFHFQSGESASAVLEAVTIINGYITNFPGEENGGAIRCTNSSSPTINNCVLRDNTAEGAGGGMSAEDSAPALTDVVFDQNHAVASFGGGAVTDGSGSVSFIRCTFANNTAGDDGGGLCAFNIVAVEDCTFDGNQTPVMGHGGGMAVMGNPGVYVAGTVFSNNTAMSAGGGFSGHAFEGVLEYCTFSNNTVLSQTTGQGGGVYVGNGVLADVNNCTFYGNAALLGGGIGVGWQTDPSQLNVSNTIILFSTQGEAVYCEPNCGASLYCCDVYGNAGGDYVSCIAAQAGLANNIELDPLFCDAAGDDYTLRSDSACAPFSPPNPACDLIGAWPVGCEPGVEFDWYFDEAGAPGWGQTATPPFWERMDAGPLPACNMQDLDPVNPYYAASYPITYDYSGHRLYAEIWMANNWAGSNNPVTAELRRGGWQDEGTPVASATVVVTEQLGPSTPWVRTKYLFDFGTISSLNLTGESLVVKIIYSAVLGDTHVYWDGDDCPSALHALAPGNPGPHVVTCEPQGGQNPSHPSTYWYDVTPNGGYCDFHVRVYDPDPGNYTAWVAPANWVTSMHQVGDESWASWWDPTPDCLNALFTPYRFQFDNDGPSTWGDWTTTIGNNPNPRLDVTDFSGHHFSENDGSGGRMHVPTAVGLPCVVVEDCGDVDANTITDDVCTWYECAANVCNDVVKAVPSDMGGAFGACPTDGFCNIHDRNHALNCFSGTSACESINVDAGGAFGACPPDGFCNIHDANHALTCFSGTNACACGPSPEEPAEPYITGTATLRVVADASSVAPGDVMAVRVFLDAKPALQSYQLHLSASGGRRGQLELIDIAIEDRKSFVFEGVVGVFDAFNARTGQMLAGLDDDFVAVTSDAYLATFTYRASPNAAGAFVIDVMHDEGNGDQTFLVGAGPTHKIEVTRTHPAVITVPRDRAERTR